MLVVGGEPADVLGEPGFCPHPEIIGATTANHPTKIPASEGRFLLDFIFNCYVDFPLVLLHRNSLVLTTRPTDPKGLRIP